MSQYRAYFVPGGTDPSGLCSEEAKCIVHSSRKNYRLTPIAQLDANYNGTPYQDAADLWQANWQKGRAAKKWQFAIPKFTTPGPVEILSPAVRFRGPLGQAPQGAAGLSLFLFYVSFDVSNPDDCELELFETRNDILWTGGKKTENPEAERLIAEAPKWGGNINIAQKLSSGMGTGTHTILVADMPGIDSQLKTLGGFAPPRYRHVSTNQRIVIKSKAGNEEVGETAHDFKIGYDSNGNFISTP